ncbi:uncharacterized protein LOC126962209 [Macaca thibetana thibetana]|uniref:uncharacterized protein LOC126962209 n=1 Tax=Macaca thibetana thibetana TaxID=257877 RepID=UPI0021BCA42F|nr:uncharacterized protein LOC126962209 [Macaca thibetana thibetana]
MPGLLRRLRVRPEAPREGVFCELSGRCPRPCALGRGSRKPPGETTGGRFPKSCLGCSRGSLALGSGERAAAPSGRCWKPEPSPSRCPSPDAARATGPPRGRGCFELAGRPLAAHPRLLHYQMLKFFKNQSFGGI